MAATSTTGDRFGRCVISKCPSIIKAVFGFDAGGEDDQSTSEMLIHELGHGLDFVARGQEHRLLLDNFGFKNFNGDHRWPKAALFLELRVAGYQRLLESEVVGIQLHNNLLSPENVASAVHYLARSDNYLDLDLDGCKKWMETFAETARPQFQALMKSFREYCLTSVFELPKN